MKNAILLHGRPGKAEYYDSTIPSASNAHWLPWLQKQLLINDIKADTPEVQFAFEPQWERWVKEVERFKIWLETILVGHSTGAGFWVRYLSERPDLKVGRVILVAPYLDVEKESTTEFFDFEIDVDIAARTKGLIIFHSDNDGPEMQSTVKLLRKKLKNFKYKELHGLGHFTHKNLPTDKFPELLEECLKGNP